MRKLLFYFREAVRVITRSGIAGGLSIIAFSVLAAVLSLGWGTHDAFRVTGDQLLRMFEMEAFLVPGAEVKADSLAEFLSERRGVEQVKVISRDEAAERFASQFGDELFDLLQENPLPASIQIRYDPSLLSLEQLKEEAVFIGGLEEIEEVVFESDLYSRFEMILGRVNRTLVLVILVTGIVSLGLNILAVKTSARASRNWARTISLLGGQLKDIRTPFIIAGMLIGLMGSFIGVSIEFLIQRSLAQGSNLIPDPDLRILLLTVVFCSITGAVTARFSAPRGWRD